MDVELCTPSVSELRDIATTMGEWAREDAPFQLHVGDLGWFWRFGADATAAALRTWRRDAQLVAVGLLDGANLLRMAIAPDMQRDDDLGRRIAAHVADPDRGVLPAGRVAVESWAGPRVRSALDALGWQPDEPWAPLRCDLSGPVPEPGVAVEVVGPDQADSWYSVIRSSFGSTSPTDRWHTMAAGAPYARARSLLARDSAGQAVAAITVWSAGPGRPGLVEPMGVHTDHRGHGYGRAICLAAAATLQETGSSAAVVATPSANTGGVATYVSAGFDKQLEVRDRYRAP